MLGMLVDIIVSSIFIFCMGKRFVCFTEFIADYEASKDDQYDYWYEYGIEGDDV